MTDEELRKIDCRQLLAEKDVLEDLLKDFPSSSRAAYWHEELERINKALEGLFLSSQTRTNERG